MSGLGKNNFATYPVLVNFVNSFGLISFKILRFVLMFERFRDVITNILKSVFHLNETGYDCFGIFKNI